jgi:alanyl-tRNA synthetase
MEMQQCIDGCGDQMQEFDEVNAKSFQIIDKLKEEVSYFQSEMEKARLEVDTLNRNIILQKLKIHNEEAFRLKDFLT